MTFFCQNLIRICGSTRESPQVLNDVLVIAGTVFEASCPLIQEPLNWVPHPFKLNSENPDISEFLRTVGFTLSLCLAFVLTDNREIHTLGPFVVKLVEGMYVDFPQPSSNRHAFPLANR